jgi:hypothetical protein
MINLTERQRSALLAGLELLAKQTRDGRAGKAGRRSWSAKQLDDLAIRLRSPEAVRWRNPEKEAASTHSHLANSNRQRTYDVLGECGIHGMICIACEVSWHIEDGPLGWCRECERVLANAQVLAPMRKITALVKRRKSMSPKRQR